MVAIRYTSLNTSYPLHLFTHMFLQKKPPAVTQQGLTWREKLPLLFPARRSQEANSTISVSNYLHVSHVKEEEEEEQDSAPAEEEDVKEREKDENVSLVSSQCCNSDVFPPEQSPKPPQPERATWPSFPAVTTPMDPLLDNVDKEEVLKRKADSLGLLSHKWAKSFLERGFLNGQLPRSVYYRVSRPSTRDEQRPGTTRPKPASDDKLDKLKSVYGRSKRSQQGNSGLVESKKTSRSPTRADQRVTALHKLSNRLKTSTCSRPPTRGTARIMHRRWRTEGEGSAPPTNHPIEGLIGIYL